MSTQDLEKGEDYNPGVLPIYNGLYVYGEVPPERGTFLGFQVY